MMHVPMWHIISCSISFDIGITRMAKRRKLYLVDPTLEVPETTAWRHQVRQSTPIDEDLSFEIDFGKRSS